MSETYISLDLETTGVKPENDEIIEVAAVKFQDAKVIDTFHTLVNPHVPLSHQIQELTGIRQADVDYAPPFTAIAGQLASFIAGHSLVGQRISFDVDFLSHNGIKLFTPAYDTFELAIIFLPQLSDYSLAGLAQKLAVPPFRWHRALPDALATKDVFLALLKQARELPLSVIAEMVALTLGREWSLGRLLLDIQEEKLRDLSSPVEGRAASEETDSDFLSRGQMPDEPLVPHREKRVLDINELTAFFQPQGPLACSLAGFEYRPQQIRMMQAVAEALNSGQHLLAEAGTGTGKSIAYLLPAIFYALQNSDHVVVSTNTINLQEQLITKDISDLLQALPLEPMSNDVHLRAVQVKGRRNYLCLRRHAAFRRSEGLSLDEVKLLLRLLVWLRSTTSGDKAELYFSGAEEVVWNRVCAQVDNCLAGQCSYHKRDACFLFRARRRAAGAHIIVVNHALLLSDMASNNRVLPEYKYLVIDEAHHLEEEATQQLGFKLTRDDIIDYLNRLSEPVGGQRETGFLPVFRNWLRGSPGEIEVAPAMQGPLLSTAAELSDKVKAVRTHLSRFFDVLSGFLYHHSEEQGDYERRLRLTRGVRSQPAWSEVEIAAEDLRLTLADIDSGLSKLQSRLEGPDSSGAGISGYDDLMQELAYLRHSNVELCRQIDSAVSNPKGDTIYWATGGQGSPSTLYAAPLTVSQLLDQGLFSTKDSIILTSATLSTEGTFEFIKERLGLAYVNELLVDAPFDYLRSTMIYIPQDIPEPDRPGYQQAVESALIKLCSATKGRTLVLFTSHAALRATHAPLRGPLQVEGINVLAQGIDGSPKQLLTSFRTSSKAVLLGTSSFWEGVDVVGEALSVLVIVRLPFSVPTDPIFAARSEMFEDPFNQYALPQAALRFKQGFGRLIRSKTDRGALVVLDSRIRSKPYGVAFVDSLPLCAMRFGSSQDMPQEVAAWLAAER